MLSPKGPSGIVARSGAVQGFAESATSRPFCDAKLLVRPDNQNANAKTIVTAKPHVQRSLESLDAPSISL